MSSRIFWIERLYRNMYPTDTMSPSAVACSTARATASICSGGQAARGFSRKKWTPASAQASSMSFGGPAAAWASGGTPIKTASGRAASSISWKSANARASLYISPAGRARRSAIWRFASARFGSATPTTESPPICSRRVAWSHGPSPPPKFTRPAPMKPTRSGLCTCLVILFLVGPEDVKPQAVP